MFTLHEHYPNKKMQSIKKVIDPQKEAAPHKNRRQQSSPFIPLYKAKAMSRKAKKFRLNLVNFVKKPCVRLKSDWSE